MSLTKDEILFDLLVAATEHPNMMWVMVALKMTGKPVQKDHLRTVTNNLYKQRNPASDHIPVRSRHLLDEVAAMLEGAALVNVAEVAKSKQYTLSRLGEELLLYSQTKRGNPNEN
jgi:hypothetical protein